MNKCYVTQNYLLFFSTEKGEMKHLKEEKGNFLKDGEA